MATLSDRIGRETSVETSERNFFRVMATIMSMVIVAGFAVNLAMGRSTFAVPIAYHAHAFVFMAWVALYLAQNWLIAAGNIRLHRTLGIMAYGWAPLMVIMGFVIMITSMRRTGGPFFFDQNEFLISNSMLLILFGTMVIVALNRRRYSGWHRRLMLTAMSILTGPGLGRLMPMPLLIPHAWKIMMAVTLIFPVIGVIADRRRQGHIHPAWWWGIGAILFVQIASDFIAYSGWGLSLTHMVVDGTPGAERTIAAFLPPNF